MAYKKKPKQTKKQLTTLSSHNSTFPMSKKIKLNKK